MRFWITILLSLYGMTLWGQESKLTEKKRHEFEAQKVAFFTQALDLTPEEAAVFWPLYNEMVKRSGIRNSKSEKIPRLSGMPRT